MIESQSLNPCIKVCSALALRLCCAVLWLHLQVAWLNAEVIAAEMLALVQVSTHTVCTVYVTCSLLECWQQLVGD